MDNDSPKFKYAEKTGRSYEKALEMFYDFKTFELISEGVADMHCMSDEYLVDELMMELGVTK